jgi:hypothetical protein
MSRGRAMGPPQRWVISTPSRDGKNSSRA